MTVRAKDLGQRLSAIIGQSKKRAARVEKSVAITALNALVQGTPVDLGRLRAGWDIATNQDSAFIPAEGVSPSADEVLARGVSRISQADSFVRTTISNNVEYAGFIETGALVPQNPGPSSDPRPGRTGVVFVSGGFLTRAPAGLLVKATLAVEEHIRELEQVVAQEAGG